MCRSLSVTICTDISVWGEPEGPDRSAEIDVSSQAREHFTCFILAPGVNAGRFDWALTCPCAVNADPNDTHFDVVRNHDFDVQCDWKDTC
jgi:hypothetical protein